MCFGDAPRQRFEPAIGVPLVRVLSPYGLASIRTDDGDDHTRVLLERYLGDLGLPICSFDRP